MPNPTVHAAPLTSGSGATIGREFWNVYDQSFDGEKEFLDSVYNPDIPSNVKVQPEGYFESAAYPVLWPDGDEISGKPFGSVQFLIYNRSWGRRIDYSEDDLIYEQTRSLMIRVRDAGQHWGSLRARVSIQEILASTDPDLLPSVGTAPDGANMFSTTAGGSARFGVTNGNSLSGSYMDSAAEVLDAITQGTLQAAQFLDTEGQPLLDPGVLSEVLVVAPAAYGTYFRQAFNQPITSNGAGTAGVTNYILNSGVQHKLWITPRLTAKAFYLFFPRVNSRPFVHSTVTPLRESYADMTNSDEARRTKQFYNQWDSREGFAIGACFGCMKLTDA